MAQRLVPHVIAIVLMAAFSYMFYSPAAFGGKQIRQPDVERAQAEQVEIQKYLKETGKSPLWTNALFSGMPSYQLLMDEGGNLTRPIFYASLQGQAMTAPHAATALAMFGAYLLFLILGADWRLSVMGAVLYGLSNYYVDLAVAGHATKMLALAYMPGIFAGAILAFRGRYVVGAGLVGLMMALQIYANHIQITYYSMLMLAIMGIAYLVQTLTQKTTDEVIDGADTHAKTGIKNWIFGSLAVAFGLAIGLLSNTARLWTTYEFSSETTRGKSELSTKADQNGGLDEKYANDWTYSIPETFTLLAPNFMGGGASGTFENTQLYKLALSNVQQQGASPEQAKQYANQQAGAALYHGEQPFVGVPIYFGAAVIFLFFLGLFNVRGATKHWLWATLLFSLMISWGNHFFVGDLLFKYFPFYNKFRAVTQALGIGQLAIIGMAVLALQAFFSASTDRKTKQTQLLIATGITVGLCFFVVLLSSGMDLGGAKDEQLGNILSMVKQDRASIMRADAMRSLFVILLAAATLFAYLRGMLKPAIAALVVGLITIGDSYLVDTRYIHDTDFVTKSNQEEFIKKTPADEQILADKDPHFRVLDLRNGNPFASAETSRYHKSMGGYFAAKMGTYQELVDSCLNKIGTHMHVVGMLNGKYLITSDTSISANPGALGNAWFVANIQTVANADAAMTALHTFNPATTAVVTKDIADSALKGFTPQIDSTNSIKLAAYNPDNMTYTYSAKTEQLAVFSEVYYPAEKGWNLYINGQPAASNIFKVNYLLRAARLPAGQNQKLEMRFEPRAFYAGTNISRIASGSIWAILVAAIYLTVRGGGFPNPYSLPTEPMPQPVAAKAANTPTRATPTQHRRKK